MGNNNYSHCRWCEPCNTYHGILYICTNYSEELTKEITEDSNKFIHNLHTAEWCEAQINKGIPVEAITVFRTLAGC